MEVFGRWISIMLCILQLTIMPAKILTMELNKQVEEYLISVTERFFCRVAAQTKLHNLYLCAVFSRSDHRCRKFEVD